MKLKENLFKSDDKVIYCMYRGDSIIEDEELSFGVKLIVLGIKC